MAESEHGWHPGVTEYVQIGVILAVLTAIEVALYFAPVIRQVTVPALLFLTALKFVLVVAWFMHLRFDHRLFRRVFLVGLALATTVFGIVIATMFLGTPMVQA
ncbi:MAG TPA: cytochrome C oxidase subunit IV family protein [Egibacteraceae bacterium]|jgi:cytochrome c oxidase subunit IV|nr:cytochrome C oxidase subunit IV family protein [Egibacteraceae bacterium]